MKLILCQIWAGVLLTVNVSAESPVTITIGSEARGADIPADFTGLSFGMKALLADRAGSHFFSITNKPLVTLFQNLGISHLRMGGTSVESPPSTPIPGKTEIDNLFAFARAAGVQKVIYSLRLLETDAAQHCAATNAAIAKYIWDHYRAQLDCFALGNEPDLQRVYKQDFAITNFSTYLSKWRAFAAAITNAVPDARFAGPDAGSGNVFWTIHFADAEKNSGLVTLVTEHFYVGGAGREVASQQGIEAMLSPGWLAANQALYDKMAVPVRSNGLPFRFTEANDHYSGGVTDASDTFAGALWALEFLHWWAAHGASGVNFHNTQWVVNDVITHDSNGHLITNPKGYGLKAFDLGGHGRSEPLTIANPEKLNVTAYAVRDPKQHFVTIINKQNGAGARSLKTSVVARSRSSHAEMLMLSAPNGDVAAKTGVTLGGASISSDAPWRGNWTLLKPDTSGHCSVEVPAASAAIVRISAE